ncbi:Pheromone B alpha 3 receptor [Mycena venus]|uniref:Pheromone B alpha 3 receptor n=1 Tax=Mycena venus TaxID=2733690 RepID=A0A8H7CNZ4_9AGAR|nr:Pheromone B alpha 3 receptor [Mycena venus]
MVLTTIELAYGLYLNITQSPIAPWISWDNTHFDFGTIDVWPVVLCKQTVTAVELSRWAQVFYAFIFFAFFGFAAEARKNYRLAF